MTDIKSFMNFLLIIGLVFNIFGVILNQIGLETKDKGMIDSALFIIIVAGILVCVPVIYLIGVKFLGV